MNRRSRLRIAIYARYSTDHQNPASVDDQVGLCRALIGNQFGKRAASVAVFSDAAISGATMERPGMNHLLKEVGAGRFDIVVAEGLDRVSRSLKDIATIHEALNYHGVKIWTAHEGQITDLHVGLKGTMNALFLRDMKEKVRRGLNARVAAGYAASSCAYGYRVVRGVVDDKGRNVNGVREIDETAAAVIRRIYQEYADGRRASEIVAGLNRDAIPAPGGGLWKKNALLGSSRKQEGVLRTEIYLGKLVFNKTRVARDPVSNKKRYILLPAEQWTRVDVPHLRIISDELWAAVRKRDHPQVQQRKKKPPRTLTAHNQHALSGWVVCGCCGSPKNLANESRYVCSGYRYARTCKNSRGTKEPVLLDAVFDELRVRVTSGRAFRPALEKAYAAEIRESKRLLKAAADIEAKIARLTNAIAEGVNHKAATQLVIGLQDELTQIHEKVDALAIPVLPDEDTIRRRLFETLHKVKVDGDIRDQRIVFNHLLKAVTLTPIIEQRSGETVAIELKEEGWPGFWREIAS